MAWTYSDWRSLSTDAAKRARLELHIQEVTDRISADVGADGQSRSSGPLNELLGTLEKQLTKLERITAGTASVARIRRN